jgi:hypothetical protein
MRRSTFNDARGQAASASSREPLNAKECSERAGTLNENAGRIPIQMMLLIGALMGASTSVK